MALFWGLALGALLCSDALQMQTRGDVPSISIYVFARVNGIERRALIRDMWKRAKNSTKMDLTYNFAVCGGAKEAANILPAEHAATASDDGVGLADADEVLKAELKEESDKFKDVLYLDCDEGYGEGALTRKVLASMNHMWTHGPSDYFMKIDDDSFLAWSRYMPHLLEVGSPKIYMGIPIGEGVPCRQEGFRWYEPYSTFDKPLFPKGMSGGSGYTIGRELVDKVLHTGLGENNVLWNEDRAVGVWMDSILQSGVPVDYQGIKGVDGFWAWNWKEPTKNWAKWGEYPHFVHHGLEGSTIACLAEADKARNDEKPISSCFSDEQGKTYEPLKCAMMNTDAQKKQKDERDKEALLAMKAKKTKGSK